MHSRTRSIRSTEAPMDFEFTSRPQTTPAWASSSGEDDPSTPKKRPHDAMTPTPLTPLHNPIFGQNQNIPFIFDTPTRPPAAPYPWAPPASFSPIKAFPSPAPMPEVDMGEASPPKQSVEVSMTSVEGGKDGKGENENEDGIIAPNSMRKVAMGGLRRIFKKRMQEPLPVSKISEDPAEGDAWSESEDEDHNQQLFRTPRRTRTSNHYTLNMPAPAPPPSDVPYILLGYLQFFFNLSLILLFLYLAVQFIWTVQRDVEERISEYSLDLVQDIAMCALQHRNNFCDNPIPAVADQCAAWATCMSRDPTIVGRARVGAEMIAEVVNGFVEPISWKTLAFTLSSLSFLTVFVNALLSLYRSRHVPHPVASAPHPAPAYQHPAQHFGGFLSPAPTPSWGRRREQGVRWAPEEEVEATPTRRRRIEGGALKIR